MNDSEKKRAVKPVDFVREIEHSEIELSFGGSCDTTDANDEPLDNVSTAALAKLDAGPVINIEHTKAVPSRCESADGMEVPQLSSEPYQQGLASGVGQQTADFKNLSLVKAGNARAANVFSGERQQNTFKKPRFTPGIVMSVVMAISFIFGASGPLHIVYIAAGYKQLPWEANVSSLPFFLNVYFLLLPIVVFYWSFCLLRLSDAFSYSSASSRKIQRTSIFFISLMFNPVVCSTLILMAWLVLVLNQPFGLLPLLAGIILPTAPIFTAFWFYRFIRTVVRLRAAPNVSFFNAQLPALTIAVCHLVPTLILELATMFYSSKVWDIVSHHYDPTINQTYSSFMAYDIKDIVTFFYLLFLGTFGAAIAQAVSFSMLTLFLSEIDVQKHPFFCHFNPDIEGKGLSLIARRVSRFLAAIFAFWSLVFLFWVMELLITRR